jgi:hypothetical protein
VREGHELAVIRGKGASAAQAGEDAAVKKGRKMTMEERLRYAQVVVLRIGHAHLSYLVLADVE